jgi:hypothetical protein
LGEIPLDKYSLEIHEKRAGGTERSSVPSAAFLRPHGGTVTFLRRFAAKTT